MVVSLQVSEIARSEWYARMNTSWHQGEHIVIIGPTGTGKTNLATELLDIREWVVVLAVKRKDETLDRFKKQGYRVIRKWPPEYNWKRVILWEKPGSLTDDTSKQTAAIHKALNQMYLAGGWTIYFDESGYIAGTLGLSRDLGILLNQGRSNYLSIVASMTRPSSVIARVPREALNQPRHKIIFKYSEEADIKACAQIAGINWHTMQEYMDMLTTYRKGYSDFLYIGESISVVRNR
jgi:hypothetical protein